MDGGIRGATCLAKSYEVVCLSVGKNALETALGGNLKELISKNSITWAVKKDEYLKKLL